MISIKRTGEYYFVEIRLKWDEVMERAGIFRNHNDMLFQRDFWYLITHQSDRIGGVLFNCEVKDDSLVITFRETASKFDNNETKAFKHALKIRDEILPQMLQPFVEATKVWQSIAPLVARELQSSRDFREGGESR